MRPYEKQTRVINGVTLKDGDDVVWLPTKDTGFILSVLSWNGVKIRWSNGSVSEEPSKDYGTFWQKST